VLFASKKILFFLVADFICIAALLCIVSGHNAVSLSTDIGSAVCRYGIHFFEEKCQKVD
jgi:hypothetical protein